MARSYQHINLKGLRISDYAAQKIGELERGIQDAQYELDFWRKLATAIEPLRHLRGQRRDSRAGRKNAGHAAASASRIR